MNIPFCILKDEKSISRDCFEYHQSLAKRLYNSSKKIKSLNSSSQSPMINYSKRKIFTWLFSLDLKVRIKICSIHNDWFSKIIFQLLTYIAYDNSVRFLPRKSYEVFYENINGNQDNMKNNDNELNKEHFNTFFEGIPPDNNNFCNNNANKNQIREKDFLKELRFYSLNTFNDTFTLSFDLLRSKAKLQEYFDSFSECNIFREKIISTKINNSNIYNFSIPNWVKMRIPNTPFSLQEIIVICFEQIISSYYQIYLLDGVIPKFDIDSKINDLLNMNENIENYLGKESNNNEIFDINKIKNQVESKEQKDLIEFFENQTENVYEIAFNRQRSIFYYDKDVKDNEIRDTINDLKREYNNNISQFVYKISLVDSTYAFKIQNIIYNLIYQHISVLCSKRNIDELCMNIDDDNDKPKNKKKKRKNKKEKVKDEEEEEVDPVVQDFIQFLKELNQEEMKYTKIKPYISEEWIKSLS